MSLQIRGLCSGVLDRGQQKQIVLPMVATHRFPEHNTLDALRYKVLGWLATQQENWYLMIRSFAYSFIFFKAKISLMTFLLHQGDKVYCEMRQQIKKVLNYSFFNDFFLLEN